MIFKKKSCYVCNKVGKHLRIHNRYFCSEECFVKYSMDTPLDDLLTRERIALAKEVKYHHHI